MPSKKYADLDFFLALLKDSDWLKEKAKKIYQKHKQEIYVTPFTLVELMIVCVREEIPLKETLFQISRIAGTTFIRWDFYFRTADFIERGATIFDALLMSFVEESALNFGEEDCTIISSDKVYGKFGFEVLNLRE